MKENQRTKTEVVGDKETKVTTIVTTGGEFKDGSRMVKASRNIVNFFGQSSKRSDGKRLESSWNSRRWRSEIFLTLELAMW